MPVILVRQSSYKYYWSQASKSSRLFLLNPSHASNPCHPSFTLHLSLPSHFWLSSKSSLIVIPVILGQPSHPCDLSHSSHPSHPRCSWDLSCTTLQILIWGGMVVWLLLQKNIYIEWYGGFVENHASSNDLVRWDCQSKHRIHFVFPTCGASHLANNAVYYYTIWFKPV